MRVEDGKKVYDSIEIPEELSGVVNRAIVSKDKAAIKRAYERRRNRKLAGKMIRYTAAAAAAVLVCFTVGLNTSEAFAMEMSQTPVIGALARVLTVRSYHGAQGDYEIDMEVPEIEVHTEQAVDGQTATGFTGDINVEIQKIVDDYMEQAKTEFQEYKEAFFATGGTEEEWGGRTMDITVDYEVKYQEGNYLSLQLVTAKGWVSAQEERHFYNLNLAENKILTLREVLGEDYVRICNESILSQIKQRITENEDQVFFGFGPDGEAEADPDIPGFTTVSADTKFYVNGQGNVVIVFENYEIAPGYMGFSEFEIAPALWIG